MTICTMKQDDLVPDGTYIVTDDGVADYAARWSYGYIVSKQTAQMANGGITFRHLDMQHGLVGVWKDSETGFYYVDLVEHISDRASALQLATERGEIAIWDLRERKEVRV